MANKLSGKIALITNAASSFGYTVARRLGSSGAQVIISDPDPTGLNFAMDGLKGADVEAYGFQADLSIEKDRKNLVESVNINRMLFVLRFKKV